MRRPSLWLLALALVAGGSACKSSEEAAAQAKLNEVNQAMADGRAALAAGAYEKAADHFKQAASVAPRDPQPYLGLAEAYAQQGNDAAAVLSLKQAEDLAPRGADPAIRKQRALLLRRMGMVGQSIAVWVELRDSGQLSDAETLALARLQAHSGDVESAYRTLERVQQKKPDDPGAKVVEAEILLVAGEEMLAAKLMDRLLAEHPDLASARLLRARYFLNSGYPDLAWTDLSALRAGDLGQPEAIELKARVLNQLKRYDEAVAAIKQLVDARPRDPELLAQLAETMLNAGKPDEARALVDKALGLKPKFAGALYVRARALEEQGELKQAAEAYQAALKSNPGFGPALSRIWRIHQHRGDKGEAMGALERLFFMGEASADEKISLAELYAESRTNLDRAGRLVDEALRRTPDDTRLKELRASIAKLPGGSRSPGVIIMKRGR